MRSVFSTRCVHLLQSPSRDGEVSSGKSFYERKNKKKETNNGAVFNQTRQQEPRSSSPLDVVPTVMYHTLLHPMISLGTYMPLRFSKGLELGSRTVAGELFGLGGFEE